MNVFARAVALVVVFLTSSPVIACSEPAGFESLANARVVVFGEYHGTKEIPRFFFNVVCTAAQKSNGTLLVGLELPEEFNFVFRELGRMPVEDLIDQIRGDAFWRSFGDGRSTGAMLRLLNELAYLASSRMRVVIVALAGNDTDAAGADLLAKAMREHRPQKALILVGNAHARLQPMGSGHWPMAAQLLERHGQEVLSLNISAGGGEAWVCLWTTGPAPGSTPECGARLVLPVQSTSGIHVPGCVSACPHQGTYHLENLSIAPPVHDN